MARILPPSVFKANFEAAEFKPTQSQRVGERFATPEGLKVGVDVVDRVGGTISDAVSRFSRSRAALARARARKKDPLGEDKGLLGYWTLSPEEQAELERQSYGAGQATVVGARDRIVGKGKDARVVRGVDERAAGYDAMRRAWDRPGSGRLLADPARDPSKLISEDYKRLASASPLPKAAAAPKPYRPMLDDVRSRHKANRPLIDDMNTAVLVREGIAKNPLLNKGFDINNLTDKQAEALVNASSGKLLLLRDDSGDKSVYTVQIKPTEEDKIAMTTAMAEGRQSEADNIRDSLRARGRALLGLLNDPNLDKASTDLNKYSMLLDQWRSIVAANPQDPRAAGILKELESYSGHIAQASGDLPTYLRNYGVRASEAQAAADKKASDQVGAMRERLDEINRKAKVAPLTSEETNQKIELEKQIRLRGGELPASSSSAETPHDPTTTATEDDQQDAWERAKGAGGLTAAPPPPPEPVVETPDQKMDKSLQARADYLRQNNVPEEIIAEVIPGYQAARDFKKNPLTLRERLATAGSSVERDPRLGGNPQRLHPVARRDLARREAAKQRLRGKIQERRETIGPMPDREAYALDRKPERKWTPDYRAPAPAQAVAAGPKSIGKQNVVQEIGGKKVTHKFPTYKPMAVNARNKKRRLAAPSAEEKSRRIKLLRSAAKKYKIDPDLYVALADQESRFHDKAVSDQFAIGLTQMTPTAWLDIGGKPEDFHTLFDESVAAESGAKFLHLLRKRLIVAKELKKNDPKENQKLMAVYNAGLSAFRNEGFEIKSKRKKDGTFFSGLMNPKRKLPLKGKDGKQLKDKKGNLRWRIGETAKYVTNIMDAYKKTKAKTLAAKEPPKAPKKGS